MSKLSSYERRALGEMKQWKAPPTSVLQRISVALNKPFDFAGDMVMKVPGVEWVIEQSIGGLVGLLADGASATVRTTAILEEFRSNGARVTSLADIRGLDLEELDRSIGYLAAKYKNVAAVEGAGAGLMGLPGIPVDIVAIVFLNLRAIGEYATYCGFNVEAQEERLFMMNVLGLASSPTDFAKQVAMAQLVKIAKAVAQKKAWKELESHAFVAVIRKIAQVLGVRLTKAKLAQMIPVAGAVVGGGFNAYYTSKVCDAAYFLYRERFLAAKYGTGVLVER